MKFDNSSARHRRAHIYQVAILTTLLTLFGTGLPQLWAGADKWTGIGPFIGFIQSLAIDPQNSGTLYAGTNGGVFKSTDGGASWNSINSAIAVFTLAIDPRPPSTLYAASYGVFKSIDGGVHWSAASSGLPTTSSDVQDGSYWEVYTLAIDPQNPGTLYAGSNRGLFKTVDGGTSWNAAGSGLPVFNAPGVLTIDPKNPDTVYAVWGCGVFKTTDGGASWKALTMPVGCNSTTLVIDPQKSGTLYALQSGAPALSKSTDGGASWSTVSATITGSTLAIDPQSSDTLYVSTVTGVLKSTDGGTSWTTRESSGLPQIGCPLLVIDPQHPANVYAACWYSGLFKTADGGANWTPANSGLSPSNLIVSSLVIDPNSNSIYAAARGLLFESRDGGSNWIYVNPGLGLSAFVLAIDKQNPRTLYAAGPPGVIFKTTDGGGAWSAAYLPGNRYFEIYTLAIDPQNPNTIYAGTSHGVYRSSDGAASWNAANIGPPGASISTLVFDPLTPNTVYAVGSGGVFKSTDGATSWNALNIPANHSNLILAIDPQIPSTIYAGSVGAIFKSTDSGTTWTALGVGLPGNRNWVNALLIDPQNPSTLYAGTSGIGGDGGCDDTCGGFHDGVSKSTDAGTTWTAVDSGLTTPHVLSLAIDPQNPSRLYAGTIGGGVFAISFGPAPIVTGLRFDRTNVAAGGSYAVTVSGSRLTPQTFFDVRFSAPGSSSSDVVLNWQKGLVVNHSVPAGIAAGSWTIDGVRAHELEADHSDSFVAVSATITISH